jgi:hypothetical protein
LTHASLRSLTHHAVHPIHSTHVPCRGHDLCAARARGAAFCSPLRSRLACACGSVGRLAAGVWRGAFDRCSLRACARQPGRRGTRCAGAGASCPDGAGGAALSGPVALDLARRWCHCCLARGRGGC